jgi:hypothetical protein
MKTVKISIVATLASILAWRLGIPRQVWPAHAQLANFILAIVICIILQIAWTDPPLVAKKQPSDQSSAGQAQP